MTSNRPSPIYLSAQRLHQAGHRVLPVRPDKKPHAIVGSWRHLLERPWPDHMIEVLFSREGVAGVALLTGFAFDVIDVEVAGLDVLEGHDLPFTPAVRTGGGGLHIYCPAGSLRNGGFFVGTRKIGDLKSRGGYVLAPPSATTKGEYAWLPGRSIHEVAVAPLPEWLQVLVAAPGRREESQRGCRPGVHAGAVPSYSGLHPGPPSAVTPPALRAASDYASRSEADAAHARRLHIAGVPRDEIVDEIARGEAAVDRRAYGVRYAERTADRAIGFADGELARARANARPATIVHVGDVPGGHEFVFRTLTENGRINDITRTLNWPPDERSRNVWTYLAAACGFSTDVDPECLVCSELLVEVRTIAGRYRITRTFAADGSEQLDAWDEGTDGEGWRSLHDREEHDDEGGEW